jgi:hypothetical protein
MACLEGDHDEKSKEKEEDRILLLEGSELNELYAEIG